VNVNVFFGVCVCVCVFVFVYVCMYVCMYVWKWVEGAEHGGVGGPFETVKIILTNNEMIQAR
jgi:hypothetical protein